MLSPVAKKLSVRALLPLLAGIAVLGTAMLAARLGARPGGASIATNGSTADGTAQAVGSEHADYGVVPDPLGLTIDQRLDRSLSYPGVRGVLRGVVGAPVARNLPDPNHPQLSLVATEFPLVVRAVFSHGAFPYGVGKTITLRVPGGATGKTAMSVEDAPHVTPGEEVYVYVQDPSPFDASRWGDNSDHLVVAAQDTEIFTIHRGVVQGEGPLAGLAEPVAVFERHFVP